MGDGVGAFVQFVAILAFVDAHAPKDDAGVVAVLLYHFPHIFAGLFLPIVITDVLPAGNFREYQQTQTVTFVEEIVTLRIVGGAHRHTAQFFFQNAGVLPLQAFRSGVADVGVALMAVETPKEGFLTVEVKAVFLKF